MPSRMLIATLAVALSAGLAGAQSTEVVERCQDRLDDLAGDFGDLYDEDGRMPPALLDLRSAAMRLVAQDRHESCYEVVEAMRVALVGYGEAGFSAATGGTSRSGDVVAAEIESRVVPFGDARIDSAAAESAEVYNFNNQKLGEVEGLLMAAGAPTHLVINHGGFWNFKPDTAAIPVSMVHWDPEWRAFFVPIAEEVLDRAPAYGVDGTEWTREVNDEYYANVTE